MVYMTFLTIELVLSCAAALLAIWLVTKRPQELSRGVAISMALMSGFFILGLVVRIFARRSDLTDLTLLMTAMTLAAFGTSFVSALSHLYRTREETTSPDGP